MNKSLLIGAALLTALAAPTAAGAATHKVGPTRAQKAPTTAFLSTLKPGDVVEIDGDATYGRFDITTSGIKAQPIVPHRLLRPCVGRTSRARRCRASSWRCWRRLHCLPSAPVAITRRLTARQPTGRCRR